ncbi:LAETG motif-containing sortase-dependent surface protein [Streptomyces sp. NPDC002004]
MKLRRAMATAAATAVIAPLALLSAPAAFAAEPDQNDTTPTSSAPETPGTPATPATDAPPSSSAPEQTPEAPVTPDAPGSSVTPGTTPTSAAPGSSAPATPTSTPPSESAEPTDEPTEPTGECETDHKDYKSRLDVTLGGLPGKIAAGSGWHPFTLTVRNPTDTDVKDAVFYAGVGPNDEKAEHAFRANQVRLQAKVEGVWIDIRDEEGYSNGFLDLSDVKGGQTFNYQLRLNVGSNAPVGSGLTIGGGLYFDEEENCLSASQAGYVIQIVKPGTDTDGTKPQEGGKVPVPTEKPNRNNTHDVTGSLAETGSSSMLPTIGLVGGLAVVAGAGAVFAVRRRRSGDATA